MDILDTRKRRMNKSIARSRAKRAAFVHRYGVLQPDGARNKQYIG
jgi:hypothetical protein